MNGAGQVGGVIYKFKINMIKIPETHQGFQLSKKEQDD
jgi:hypothetical protein